MLSTSLPHTLEQVGVRGHLSCVSVVALKEALHVAHSIYAGDVQRAPSVWQVSVLAESSFCVSIAMWQRQKRFDDLTSVRP